MNCPACTHTLRSCQYEGVQIDTCDGCGGEFLSSEGMGQIIRVRDQRFSEPERSQLAHRKPVFGIADADATTRFCCPACRVPMNPINYAGDSGVVVDRCPSCAGLWLDHSELEKVQILLERWQDESPGKIQAAAAELHRARDESARSASKAFNASRFSFANAVVNRLLDAA